MIRVFEAFAGYGSTCFALKELGIEHELVGFSEIDKYAIQVFQQNHNGKNFGDITKINWKEGPDFDLLTGGFPCQAFSTAGKQQGEADPRGQLGLYLTIALIEKQPKYFLFENVKGFMSKRFEATRKKFIQSWEDAGYIVHQKVLNTKDFGVPQNRERVWFVGTRKDLDIYFDYPQPFELKLKLKDLLEENVDNKFDCSESAKKLIFSRNKNFVCKFNPDITNTIRTNYSNSFSNETYISATITTENAHGFGKNVTPKQAMSVCLSGGRLRKLTPKECFRLQGFLKDQINLEGLSDTQKYRLAGNGQSVNVVKLLLKELVKNECD